LRDSGFFRKVTRHFRAGLSYAAAARLEDRLSDSSQISNSEELGKLALVDAGRIVDHESL
jgi:hypothetical protein